MHDVHPLRVLIVDGDPNARSALAELLDDAGHRTFVAGGIDEAIELMDKLSPDVLLTDDYVPELGGQALAEHLAHKDPAPEVFVVSAAPPVGRSRWFGKPIDVPALLDALSEIQPER